MSRSAGSLWPAARRPSEICFLMRRAMTSDTRPGRPELLGIGVNSTAASGAPPKRERRAARSLENELHSKLDLPCRRGRGNDLPRLRIPGAARGEDNEVRQPEVGDIERVERLEAELHRVPADRLVLEE